MIPKSLFLKKYFLMQRSKQILNESHLFEIVSYIAHQGVLTDSDRLCLVGLLKNNMKYSKSIDNPKGIPLLLVTPSYNSVNTIDATIISVIAQSRQDIIYHIQDGASDDGTGRVLQQWKIIINQHFPDLTFSYSSSKDVGMYDAIICGFDFIIGNYKDRLSNQDAWMSWINSDDILYPRANLVLQETYKKHGYNVEWVTGRRSVCSAPSTIRTWPTFTVSDLVALGLYDGSFMEYIQQEGTFWKLSAYKNAMSTGKRKESLRRLRFAGDWYLWVLLARSGIKIFDIDVPLGVFFVRPGQLSSNIDDYNCEISTLIPEDERQLSSAKSVKRTYEYNQLSWDQDLKESSLQRTVAIRFTGQKQSVIVPPIEESRTNTNLDLLGREKLLFTTRLSVLETTKDAFRFLDLGAPYGKQPRDKFGICILSHTRVEHLSLILASLKRDDYLRDTVVFIDGHQGKQRLIESTSAVEKLCISIGVEKIIKNGGLFGTRKNLLHALYYMMDHFKSFLVLEDDCYPLPGGVNMMECEVCNCNDPQVFSIYGSHFEVDGEEPGKPFNRFQGWGWAVQSDRVRTVIDQLSACFGMSDCEFRHFVNLVFTEDVKRAIDITKPRNPSVCLEKFFAWDETLAMLTYINGFHHRPSSRRAVINFGLDEDGTSFEYRNDKQSEIFRKPPFCMKTLGEIQLLHRS